MDDWQWPQYGINHGQEINLDGTIDHFKNMVVNVGYTPGDNITLVDASGKPISITMGITAWQIKSITPVGNPTFEELGAYKTDYQTSAQSSLHGIDIQLINSGNPMLSGDKETQEAGRMIADRSGILYTNFNPDAYSTVQHYSRLAPTTGNAIVRNHLKPAQDQFLNVTLGYDIQPAVEANRETLRVGNVTHLEIRTDSTYPIGCLTGNTFLGIPVPSCGPAITGPINIEQDNVQRNVGIRTSNYVTQQKFNVVMNFWSTVQLEGITSKAFLGVPDWQQGNVVFDAEITGNTAQTIGLLHQQDIGDFIANVGTLLTATLLDIVLPIIIIAVIALVMIVAFRSALSKKQQPSGQRKGGEVISMQAGVSPTTTGEQSPSPNPPSP
jgi:hypothetical protein